jgi:hypothetical protein
MDDENYKLRIEEVLKKYATPEERLAFQDGVAFQINEFRNLERITKEGVEDIESESEMYYEK